MEKENALEEYKLNEWMKLDQVARDSIQMHLSEPIYYNVQSCLIAYELWKTLSDTYEKKVAATKIYLIQSLYNLRMKESDLVTTHLNAYESIISQLSAQKMTIRVGYDYEML